MRYCVAVVLFVALVPSASAETVRVLFVGNSYTGANNLPAMVADVLEATGMVTVETAAVTPGGYTLGKHAADADGSNGDTTLRDLLVTGGYAWDVVVLQDQSQIPGFPNGQAQKQSSAQGAKILAKLATTAGARPLLFQTWGRRDGDTKNPVLFADYVTMQNLLVAGYDEYLETAATAELPVWIAPVGRAWERIFNSDSDLFATLYSSDGSHPATAGTYLAACTIVLAATGRVPSADWVPNGLSPAVGEALRAAAVQEVFSEPVLPLQLSFGIQARYPWVRSLSEWPGDLVTVDHAYDHPWVSATEPRTLSSLAVVAGRLLVRDGALLRTETLSSLVAVEQSGGRLTAETLSAPYHLTGGTLDVEASATATEPLRLFEAGTIEISVGPLGPGVLTVAAGAELNGRIALSADADAVVVESSSPFVVDVIVGALTGSPELVSIDGWLLSFGGAVTATSNLSEPPPVPDSAEVEPTPVEPTPVEPTPVEPTPVEPTPVEPWVADSGAVEQGIVEPTSSRDDGLPTDNTSSGGCASSPVSQTSRWPLAALVLGWFWIRRRSIRRVLATAVT
jgi:MYXO-CTERM domain-containing protein